MADDFETPGLDRLLGDAKNGCCKARDQLFRELEPYLKIVTQQNFNQNLRAKLGQSDVLQQTMLNAAEKFTQFNGSTGGELKAWLKQILIHEVHRSERVFFSDKRNIARERSGPTDSLPHFVNHLADSLPTPGTRAIGAEQSAHILTALKRLPEDYQAVIQLRNWQGQSFKEIATTLDRTENAVTKLWVRALVRLQEELERPS